MIQFPNININIQIKGKLMTGTFKTASFSIGENQSLPSLNQVIIMVLMLFSSCLGAQTYLIDFSSWQNPNDGGAAFTWNSLTSSQTNVILVDDAGVSGAVTLAHDLQADNNHNSAWTAGNVGWVDTRAVDGLYSGTNGSVTISGLDNGTFYGIDVVSLETSFPSVADIRVQGNFANSNRLGTTALGDNWDTAVDGANNWLTWTNVLPASGSITVSITAVNPGYSTLSAIRIQVLGVANTAPTAQGFSIDPVENSTYTFATGDFSYTDIDGDTLDHVLIEVLPVNGILYLDANNNDLFDGGEQLNNGSLVSKSSLDNGHLQYVQNGVLNATVQFEVNDGTESSSGDYLVQIVMTPVPAIVNSVNVPSNDTYINNENLDFTVNFSKNVDVNITNGLPFLGLTIGGSDVAANYISGDGLSALLFRYVVQSGDEDTDGISVNSLSLNGGIISSNGGLAANSALNAVGNTSAVLVDAIAPQLQSVTRQSPLSSPTSADQVTLRYAFTESVSGIQSFNFASNNPTVITTISVNPVSSSIYDVTFGGPALAEYNGSIIFGLIISGITDLPGNAMQNATVIGVNDNSYVFENTYFIGGVVSGLLEGNYLVLTNQGGDDETIMTNGVYVFDSPLVNEEAYLIEIDLQPNSPIQPCTVSNGDSSINAADVIDIDIICETGTDLIYRNGFEVINF